MIDQRQISSFVAPVWWIRAFEISLQLRALQTHPFEMTQSSGLSPALTDAEMNSLLVVLQSAQNQILSGQKWISFEPETLCKNNPYVAKTRKFLFLRLIQMLRSIQVGGVGSFDLTEPVTLFEREERRRDQGGKWKSMLRLAPMAAELILGYGEPYAEVVRLLDGKPRVHRILGRYMPIQLRPSVWLELSQLEQFIFLQIQKASFWEKSNLRWDAVFGKSFESLFHGLEIESKMHSEREVSSFRRKMKLLMRVGAKLVDQGLLSIPHEIDYLAIDQDGEPLSVMWQLHERDNHGEEVQLYEVKCARYFKEHVLDASIKKLSAVLVPVSNHTLESSINMWKEIDDADSGLRLGYERIEGNLLLSIPVLFYEWTLRMNAENVLQIPGWLKDSPAVQVIGQKKPLVERLQLFSQIMKDHSEYQKDLESLPRATLASPVSLRQHEVLEYLASHTMKHISLEVGRNAADPSVVQAGTGSFNKTASNQVRLPSVSNSDVEMRKLVSEELLRIRENEPKKYTLLKKNYLENLESERKQIILEMKERMKPSAFDDHLKYSLVKYLVENPAAWQSD